MTKKITSPENPHFRALVKLQHSSRERRKALHDLVDRLIANGEALGIPMEDLVEALVERAEQARGREA